MRRFNPILSSLTSPVPPFLRRYPFAHVFVFFLNSTLYHYCICITSCCIAVLRTCYIRVVSSLQSNGHNTLFTFCFYKRAEHIDSAPFRSATQWSALQFNMFRRIMLDPKILRKLFSIKRGKRIRHKRPEANNNASIICLPKTK